MIARSIWLVLACLAATPAVAAPRCGASSQTGATCECRLADLHPTQPALGLQRIGELKQEGYDRLAATEAKPGHRARIVIGPGGGLYVVDGHHHARAMSDLRPDGAALCEVAGDAQDLPADPAGFWAGMASRGYAHLQGPDGVTHPGAYPPRTLAGMTDDPFRYLAGRIEYTCHAKLEGDFAEFRLADLLRADPANPAPHDPAAMQRSERQAMRFVTDPANRSAIAAIPGAERLTTCR